MHSTLTLLIAAATVWALALIATLPRDPQTACLDAGFTPEHCKAWSSR